MDINNRDEAFAKKEKQQKMLKESYAGMFKNFSNDLLNEDAFATQKKLKASNKADAHKSATPLKEEDGSDDEVKPVDNAPVDKAADAPAPAVTDPTAVPPVDGPAGSDVPPPVSTGTPEGGEAGSQDQMTTRAFATAFLKGLPSDVNLEQSVDANGVFKASVNDPQQGQFTIVAFPASKTIHQVADLVEPALPGAGAPGMVPVPGADAGLVPPVPPVPGAVPPVDGAAAPAGEVPPVAPEAGSETPAPEGDEEEPADKLEEEKCMNKHCSDPHCPQHGMEAGAMNESEREKQRDPIVTGRKDWSKYLANVLNESKKAAASQKLLKEEAEKKVDHEARIASIKKQIADETDAEEKKELEKALEKAISEKNKDHTKDVLAKKPEVKVDKKLDKEGKDE